MDGVDTISALREALRFSPDNVPLRQHLADTLLGRGHAAEAEAEYREALAQAPNNQGLKLGLARAYYQQGKYTAARIVAEDLLDDPVPPARAYRVLARIWLAEGDLAEAAELYRQALAEDPSLADDHLSHELGVEPGSQRDEDEVSPPLDSEVATYPQEVVSSRSEATEKPEVTFADIGGMDQIKEEIRLKIIHPLNHPAIYQAYGKSIGGGILMYGPPGCGKTHLARATAGEVEAEFLSVGINDVLDMYLGNSEKQLHQLFELARSHRPCVLFFDEVDALGANRRDFRNSAGRQVINQFLAEMDGIEGSNDGVLILGATNAPWHLDTAFRRPGRFDRILFVPPPDATARAAILRIQLRGKPVEDIDYDHLARKTEGFTGADLEALVDRAVEAKLARAMAKGQPEPLATTDILDQLRSFKPTTQDWFATARNYALYANETGIYDDILEYLGEL